MRNDQRQQRRADKDSRHASAGEARGVRNDGRRLAPGLLGHVRRTDQEGHVNEAETARGCKRKRSLEDEPAAAHQKERQSDARDLEIRDIHVCGQDVVALLKDPEQLQIQGPEHLRGRIQIERIGCTFRGQQRGKDDRRSNDFQPGMP